MEFLVLDFEIAMRYDPSSICQAGLVKFDDGEITTLYDSLIFTDQHFTETKKHGITADMVKDAPNFDQVYDDLKKLIENQYVFTHNGSDKTFIEAACKASGIDPFNVQWINSATLVRRTWSEFSQKGYSVENVAQYLGILFTPHNAASDAWATAKIIEEANKIKGYADVNEWVNELSKPKKRLRNYPDHGQRIKGEVTTPPDLDAVENKDNPFYGKKVVVSGQYEKWPDRTDLAMLLKSLGADIDTSVSKKTNILCAGRGVGPKKIELMTSKIERGEDARIINEVQIIEMLNNG